MNEVEEYYKRCVEKEIETFKQKLFEYVTKNKDLKFSLGEIIEDWGDCYGESIVKEYPGFIVKLLENETN